MRIGIVGLGFVGLSLTSVLASKGFNVVGIDVDKEKCRKISDGVSPFFEPDLENTLKNMLIEDKPLKNFWHLALQERTGLDQRTIWGRINDSPTYKVIKDQGAVSLKNRFNKLESHSQHLLPIFQI